MLPRLIQWEVDGDFSKEELNQFLTESPHISILPEPVRHEIDKSVVQRRMDSLARLLSIRVSISPCVAVACYEGQLIVSSNSPIGKTQDELRDYFNRKLRIIHGFLGRLALDTPPQAESIDTVKIEFSILATILAEKAVDELIKDENGGVGAVLPSREHRKPHRNTVEQHLRIALLKLGQSYLLGLYSQGKRGLNSQEIQAFSNDAEIIMVFPIQEALGEQQLHAEQAILYYLKHSNALAGEATIHIGISKLCCLACNHVLERSAGKIAFRGTHGMSFPKVYDIVH